MLKNMLLVANWPPKVADIPLVYDTSSFDIFTKSLKLSIGSIADNGLLILGVCLSVVLIGDIFRKLFLGELNSLDVSSNIDISQRDCSSLSDGISERELSSFSSRRSNYRKTSRNIERSIYTRQNNRKGDKL